MLLHNFHQCSLHKLVKAGELLIDQSLVIKEAVDYYPKFIAIQSCTRRVLVLARHVDVFRFDITVTITVGSL